MGQLNIFENIPSIHNVAFSALPLSSLFIHGVYIPDNISFNTAAVLITTPSATFNNIFVYFGLYSLNGSTLSLANSGSVLRSGNVNIRWTTLITSATQNISAGNWYFGFFLSNTYSNNGLGSILCWGNNQNISNGVYGGPFIRGVFSTTTNAMPASIHTSNMNKETTNETTRHPYILIAA